MERFRCELFEDPTEFEETPLRDRKQELPNIVGRGDAQRAKKAELLRDVISLANSARLFGKPAYLLFGITEDVASDGRIRGINDDLSHYKKAPSETAVVKLRENARQEFAKAIHEYVTPVAKWELLFGECGKHQLAYMRIDPIPSEQVFQVGKEFSTAQEVLKKGDSWIRFGESKHQVHSLQISPNDDRFRYAYSTAPYVLPSHWEQYFTSILAEKSIADDANMPYYIDQYLSPNLSLTARVQQFLDSSTERLLVIEGAATSGKSAFLNRLCHRLATEGLAAVREAISREEFLPPSGWIPISFSLRNRGQIVRDSERLARSLLDHINMKGRFWTQREHRPTQPERLLEHPDLRWLICFDGLDEIMPTNSQTAFLGSLRSLMERYPNVRILLTTRPYPAPEVVWEKWPNTTAVEIQPLHTPQIRDYISAQGVTTDELEQIMAFLSQSPDLLALCSYPGYLVATTQELVPHSIAQPLDAPAQVEDVKAPAVSSDFAGDTAGGANTLAASNLDALIFEEPLVEKERKDEGDELLEQDGLPRVGIVLQRVYDYLWRREAKRWNLLKYGNDAMWDSAGRLAIATDGKKPIFSSTLLKKHLQPPRPKVQQWLLTLGILHQPNYLQWAFQNHLVKTFFAAWWISSQLACDERDIVCHKLSHCTDDFIDGVKEILAHLYDGDPTDLFPSVLNHDQNAT